MVVNLKIYKAIVLEEKKNSPNSIFQKDIFYDVVSLNTTFLLFASFHIFHMFFQIIYFDFFLFMYFFLGISYNKTSKLDMLIGQINSNDLSISYLFKDAFL